MSIVTPAEPAHSEEILALAEEMDCFYGATEIAPYDTRIRQINEALFSDPPMAHAILAWNDQRLVGMATYSFLWPAVSLTRSLYLKELYVARTTRRRGIGKLLMHNVYEVAAKHNCSRVEWTADRDSTDARKFYSSIGVPVSTSKLFYRTEGERQLLDAIARTATGQG
ncbi:MAG: GNAT family N-acetyltransferase [Acidobacteria bacterium]|nr:GNAT family N-acetyltransferase [Acidobacteriota bacterium]